MTARKFYETTIQVVVLSETLLGDMSLTDIDYAITKGDCSGEVRITRIRTLNGKQAAIALEKQGSDPAFFRLTESGKDDNG